MKAIPVVAISLAALGGTAIPSPSAYPARHGSAFACEVSALTPEERKRHFDELGPALRALRKSVHELSNGYEFEFPADAKTFALLTEWIAGERACCPFFEINLRVDPERGPLWLRLAGREGVKRFIEADGAAWLKK